MPDSPSPYELARDIDQLTSTLKDMRNDLAEIRKDTSQILAEQARVAQKSSDHERRIGRLETDQTNNRRLVIGSLLFPIAVILIGALVTSGGGL